jgi:large subunit ribosomal protein L31
MKAELHPQYKEIQMVCACGASVMTKSTAKEIRLDICSTCHPFFTGLQKIVDAEGRVERFRKKYAKK